MSPPEPHPLNCDCDACLRGHAFRARPRLTLATPTAPTVVPPAADVCPGCRRPLVPGADGGRPCGGCDSDVRVTRAVAATLLAEGLAAALSPEESRSYVRRLTRAQAAAHGHPVDGEVPRG